MNSSESTDYKKLSAPPASSAPPLPYGQPAEGIPGSYSENPQYLVPWSTGLCDCFDDVSNCCITCWCPCITFGQIAEIVDQGSTSCGVSGALYALIYYLTGLAFCYSCFYRSKMRAQFALHKSPCGDCLVHCCCEHCALCQEYRELRNRGFDMAIGWHGNMARQSQGIFMAPVVQEGMSRDKQ